MAEQVEAHETHVSLAKAAPAQLYAGDEMALKVEVSCDGNCDLQGGRVQITGNEGAIVAESGLVSFDGTSNGTAEFTVKAPIEPGEYNWVAVFEAQDDGGIPHEAGSAPFSFVVKPHTTSMAVWDVPSPIAIGSGFTIKVGVKCSAGCKLTGKAVEIYDREGARVATGSLSDVPWSRTGALYWAEVELEAPSGEGPRVWEAKFLKPELEIPHEGASHTFAFRIVRQPEHVLTVEVFDAVTNTPVKGADVVLHPYIGTTDERGVATLMVPKGEYELSVLGSNKRNFDTTIRVDGDVSVRAGLRPAPAQDYGV